jgi:hypothetical protein
MAELKRSNGEKNSALLKKIDDLKNSDETYVIFGIFSTEWGDHMVPINDMAGEDGSFAGSIIKSSGNDTNWDNRFDSNNLVGVRYFEMKTEIE